MSKVMCVLRVSITSTLLCNAIAIAMPGQRVSFLAKPTQKLPTVLNLINESSKQDSHKAQIGSYGFDEAGQDLSTKPGDDFFTFANGKYLSNLKMPDDQSQWGSFDILNENAMKDVRAILEESQKAGGKLGNYWSAYMNKDAVNTLDDRPLKATLLTISSMKDAKDYASLSGTSARNFLPTPFGVGIGPDDKDVKSYCVSLNQAGLGMAQDYYLKPDLAAKKAAYKAYAAKLLDMVKWPDPQTASEQIIALEDKIANVSWSPAQQRDPIKNYNKMADVEDLQKQAPGFDWASFLNAAGLNAAGDLPKNSKLIVGALGGVVGIAKILGETDIETLRSYTAFHYAANTASLLSDRFVSEAFKFQKALTGKKTMSPRWKRAVASANGNLGMEVGKEYVKKHFPESAKAKIKELTSELKDAFNTRLEKLDWMTDSTRLLALDKLSSFDIQVGYPKKWRDYTNLKIDAGDLYGNSERAIAFEWEYSLGKLGTTVDRDEWVMTPQTVNAYNNPQFNQVVFPAAILQPPFFDPNADMAVNFGGIGAVIGHEMTHGFDDQGRHYDADGQLHDWWTSIDSTKFKAKADAYGKQFGSFDVGVPNAHIKPELTMGEDIADLGGLTLALQAYKTFAAKGKKTSLLQLDNATSAHEGLRRVFFGWAQVWREKARPDALIAQLASDPHPPSKARVDIPCSNLDQWYNSFDVEAGQKNFIAKGERVVIW